MYGIDDPAALLRPWKSLQQFSEELYAMFRGSKPLAQEPSHAPEKHGPQPTQIRRPPSASSIEQAQAQSVRRSRLETVRTNTTEVAARDSHATTRRTATPTASESSPRQYAQPPATHPAAPPSFAVPARSPQEASSRGEPPTATERPSLPERRLLEPRPGTLIQTATAGGTIPASRPLDAASEPHPRSQRPLTSSVPVSSPDSESTPPSMLSEKRASIPYEDRGAEFTEPRPFTKVPFGNTAQIDAPSAGTSLLIGQVTAFDSEGVHVTTYSNGPDQDPDPGEIVVNIPGLAEDAVFPPNYWLASIYTFSDTNGNTLYYAFPPMWVA